MIDFEALADSTDAFHYIVHFKCLPIALYVQAFNTLDTGRTGFITQQCLHKILGADFNDEDAAQMIAEVLTQLL